MDDALKRRINNQIFKFEVTLDNAKDLDESFTLDFEEGRYRQKELVGLIRDNIPFFALTEDELNSLDKSEWNRKSITRISDANRNAKGDYGELLLFLILSVFYDTPKFVTKARLRSTTKDQIKGFDCAHFSIDDDVVTLWLGEAKFHNDFSNALTSAFNSLNEHLSDSEKIKSELKLLGGEIEINKSLNSDEYDLLVNYVDGGKSLDKLPISVPVLITYDSTCINNFCNDSKSDITSDIFKEKLSKELNGKFKTIYKKKWPNSHNVKIIFFIIPFESVSDIKEQIELVETAMKF